jgi:hypothetical protein
MNFTIASFNKAYLKLNNGFLCLLAIVLLASCTKPQDGFINTRSGGALFNAHKTDTISLDMVTEILPRLPNTANLSADILGTFNDPLFGRTTASVYTQVRIGASNYPPVWKNTSTLDSLVLTLKLADVTMQLGQNGMIGKDNFNGQKWHIYKLSQNMPSGISVPSDTTFKLSMQIGEGMVSFNTGDSILRLSIKGSNVATNFRDSLFDSTGNSALFTDQTEFDQLMHGIYIAPDSAINGSGNGTLAAFNLRDTNSRITIYYDSKYKWYMTMYASTLQAQSVNIYNHNYTNTTAHQYAALPAGKADRVFIQSLGGVRCWVKIPYLGNLVKDSMVAVNQAEFIFPRVDSSADPYNNNFPPKILFRPRAYNGSDSLYNFRDDLIDYYQQNYQSSSRAYKYLMTTYIQRLLYNYRNRTASNKPLGFNLYIPPDNPNTPSRVLLYTQHTGNVPYRPKLVITYTKVADKK